MGQALCMQIDFTPWGARRFLGVEMHELTDRVIDLRDVVGSFADRIEERLAELNSWDARFDLIEQAVARRIAAATDEHPLVSAAWDILQHSHGEARIGAIARELDCSRKHLVTLFHREIGLPPKTVARILRFERALTALSRSMHVTLADLAASCGYADQAHFNRDFAAFAGETPRELRERVLPDGTGIMAG
jgi:AraC-like DNA-binding protein